MNEFFKKIGIPATVAGFAGAVVTAALFIFQVDTRYAKTDVVQSSELRVNAKIDALTSEVSKLTGATQVLIQISTKLNVDQQQQRLSSQHYLDEVGGALPPEPNSRVAAVPAPPPPVEVVTTPTPSPTEAPAETPASPLSSRLRAVELPAVSSDEIREADTAKVQDLLNQTNNALNDSKENLKTIQSF